MSRKSATINEQPAIEVPEAEGLVETRSYPSPMSLKLPGIPQDCLWIRATRAAALAARSMGKGILVVGARQNFCGHLQEIDDTAVLLSDACVAFDTGDLRTDDYVSQQSPPLGTIVIPSCAIDAIFVGKPTPRDASKP